MKTYDVIVIGVGSMGSSTCYYLAKNGYRVLGIEQFDLPHDLGSHAGQSRIIRKAYFEHPDYVPLLEGAYKNWKELEEAAGTQLYFPSGLLYAGKSDSVLIQGVKESATKYNINVDSISGDDAKKKFSTFHIPDAYEILFEPNAGFLTPERCILTYGDEAIKFGASIKTKEKVIEWKKEGSGVKIVTNRETYFCEKLVITAGPWAGELIAPVRDQLKVTRQVIAWVNTPNRTNYSLGNFPCWMIDDDSQPGMFYGFPQLEVQKFGGPIGLKAAHHYPGKISDPNKVEREISIDEENSIVEIFDKYLPGAFHSFHTFKTCLYTNSPDEHFIIDNLPGTDNRVMIAAGFSGHGFKFASVIGEILSNLVIHKIPNYPIEFLGLNRFLIL